MKKNQKRKKRTHLIMGALFFVFCHPQAIAQCRYRLLQKINVEDKSSPPKISATINNTPVVFIMDTGSNTTIITTEAAQRLRLQPDRNQTSSLYGIHDRQEIRHYDAFVPNFFVGPLKIKQKTIHTGFKTPPNITADGIIGRDLLSYLGIDLNYPQGVVDLWYPTECKSNESPQTPWDFNHLTLFSPAQTPSLSPFMVPTTINKTPLRAMIDTGASLSVISEKTLQKSGENIEKMTGPETYGPDGKIIPTFQFDIKTLSINHEKQDKTHILGYQGDLPSQIDMIIGIAPWLQTHRIWLDPLTRTYSIPEPE